jgi:hypothetical protein
MKDREKFMLAQVALRLELLAGMAGKCECPPRLCKLAGVMSEVIEAYINNPKDNFTLFAEMTQGFLFDVEKFLLSTEIF